MEPSELLDIALCIALRIPTSIDYHAAPLHTLPYVALWDSRENAGLMLTEALASRHGEVVATTLEHRDMHDRQVVAVLIRIPPGRNPYNVAAELLVGYAIGTAEKKDQDAAPPS